MRGETMIPRRVRVNLGITVPHAEVSFANVKPEIALEADVEMGETLEEVEERLEEQVARLVVGLAKRGLASVTEVREE